MHIKWTTPNTALYLFILFVGNKAYFESQTTAYRFAYKAGTENHEISAATKRHSEVHKAFGRVM